MPMPGAHFNSVHLEKQILKKTQNLSDIVCVCELLCFFEDPGSCTLSYFAHTQPVFPTSTVFDHALGPSWRKQD